MAKMNASTNLDSEIVDPTTVSDSTANASVKQLPVRVTSWYAAVVRPSLVQRNAVNPSNGVAAPLQPCSSSACPSVNYGKTTMTRVASGPPSSYSPDFRESATAAHHQLPSYSSNSNDTPRHFPLLPPPPPPPSAQNVASPSAPASSPNAWLHVLVAGGVAGAVSRTLTAPLDRCKVLLQVDKVGGGGGSRGNNGDGIHVKSKPNKRPGAVACFRHMLASGGFFSMWKGNGVNVAKIAPETAIKFAAFERIKAAIKNDETAPLGIHQRLFAGASAGAIAQTCVYPMEIVKTRLIISLNGEYRGVFDCALTLWRKEGPKCFFKGYLPNLLGIIPYASIDLTLYELLKEAASRRKWTTGKRRRFEDVDDEDVENDKNNDDDDDEKDVDDERIFVEKRDDSYGGSSIVSDFSSWGDWQNEMMRDADEEYRRTGWIKRCSSSSSTSARSCCSSQSASVSGTAGNSIPSPLNASSMTRDAVEDNDDDVYVDIEKEDFTIDAFFSEGGRGNGHPRIDDPGDNNDDDNNVRARAEEFDDFHPTNRRRSTTSHKSGGLLTTPFPATNKHVNRSSSSVESSSGTSSPGVACLLLCGVASSSCAQCVAYPLALVRVRMQAGSEASMTSIAREIWATRGWRGFYRGIGPNLLKVAPAFGISYAVYENVKRRLAHS